LGNNLREFNYGSTIDLHQGYFQMMLHEQDRPYFSFKYKYKVYQFKRAPMGAKNSPSFFQSNMELLLADLRTRVQGHSNIFVYMDDILVLTKGSCQLHLTVVEDLIKIIHQKNRRISFNKSCFLRTSVSFLSWTFSRNTITPTISPHLLHKPLPITRKELYSMLQCFNYFRLSIPNFHERTKDLYQLSKGPRNEKVPWSQDLISKYRQFCQYLFNSPKIYMYDESQPLILRVDGSNSGVGGFLCQKDVSGIARPLGFFSYPLQHTKRPRAPTFIELTAISRGISTFRYLIQGKPLTIESDHRPLAGLIKSSTSPKFMEQISSITQYTTDIKYINKESNLLADMLSRLFESSHVEVNQVSHPRPRGRPRKLLPVPQEKIYIDYESLPLNISLIQREDEELVNSLKDGKFRGIDIEEQLNGIIVTKDSRLPIITDDQTIASILKICHDQSGHWNHVATQEIIQNHVYIPNLPEKCKSYVEHCDTCNRFNSKKHEQAPSVDQDFQVFECLSADAVGPLESTKNSSCHIMLYVCPASKFVIAHSMKELTGKSIINSLQLIKSSYTLPRILRTDGAKYWTCKEVESYLESNQVSHSISTPMNSTGNAYAERYIRSLQTVIGKFLLDNPSLQWDQILPDAIYSINHYPRHGTTPYQTMLRYKPSTRLQLALQRNLENNELNDLKTRMTMLNSLFSKFL
uniref:RNA-directed DNA polymerase n=1 Tax=Strongyloides papillosus TaxID=174720 RepID=A0A0N5BXW4_STREA